MTTAATATGVDGFIAGLRRCGIDATVNTGIAVFTVVAAGRSGLLTTQTGVATAELTAWPAVPPHWAHFRNDKSSSEGDRIDGNDGTKRMLPDRSE